MYETSASDMRNLFGETAGKRNQNIMSEFAVLLRTPSQQIDLGGEKSTCTLHISPLGVLSSHIAVELSTSDLFQPRNDIV